MVWGVKTLIAKLYLQLTYIRLFKIIGMSMFKQNLLQPASFYFPLSDWPYRDLNLWLCSLRCGENVLPAWWPNVTCNPRPNVGRKLTLKQLIAGLRVKYWAIVVVYGDRYLLQSMTPKMLAKKFESWFWVGTMTQRSQVKIPLIVKSPPSSFKDKVQRRQQGAY